MKRPVVLRARAVWPVSRPLIADGSLVLARGRVERICRWKELGADWKAKAVDLGEVLVMPGLVNAHCHLDYTHFAGQLPPPKLFTDWIKLIVSAKAASTLEEYAQAWTIGAEMLLRTGTTTVGDIEAVPQLLPAAWDTTPLRVISFLELLSLTRRQAAGDLVHEAIQRASRQRTPRSRASLSPHAPYSTLPELLVAAGQAVRKRRWPLSVHVAESATEFEMFTRGQGEMFDWLKRTRCEMADCDGRSPVQHLERCELLGPRTLAIHANYLAKGDAQRLGRRGAHVVHCARSHDYFGHEAFPLRALRNAGVNVCLGTDSLASVYQRNRQQVELSMFEEMRAVAREFSWLRPVEIIAMATVNGAKALGLSGRAGELSENSWADLVALPFNGRLREAHEAILEFRGRVSASLIAGRWAIPPKQAIVNPSQPNA